MNKQPDKVFALYYRAARTNDNDTTLHLDNQMHQLLQYARQHGIDMFWAKREFKEVYALSFVYGQKHVDRKSVV